MDFKGFCTGGLVRRDRMQQGFWLPAVYISASFWWEKPGSMQDNAGAVGGTAADATPWLGAASVFLIPTWVSTTVRRASPRPSLQLVPWCACRSATTQRPHRPGSRSVRTLTQRRSPRPPTCCRHRPCAPTAPADPTRRHRSSAPRGRSHLPSAAARVPRTRRRRPGY